jgi:hypothetical protein
MSSPRNQPIIPITLAQGRFPAYLGFFPDQLPSDRSLDSADHRHLLSAPSQ